MMDYVRHHPPLLHCNLTSISLPFQHPRPHGRHHRPGGARWRPVQQKASLEDESCAQVGRALLQCQVREDCGGVRVRPEEEDPGHVHPEYRLHKDHECHGEGDL